MAIELHWHEGDEELREGNYTCSIASPEPVKVASNMKCPMCGGGLRRVVNIAALSARRVVKILKRRDALGRIQFLGDSFPSHTHELLSCKACRLGFSMLKSARAVATR